MHSQCVTFLKTSSTKSPSTTFQEEVCEEITPIFTMPVSEHREVERVGICFQYIKSGTCRFGSKCKYIHDKLKSAGNSEVCYELPFHFFLDRFTLLIDCLGAC